jgi:tetratricopeptide (TPR) repeat protein
VIGGYSGELPIETIPKAREAATKALLLDDDLSEAHVSLAIILYAVDYDFARAENEFESAIELNPKNAAAYGNYGQMLMGLGRFEESLAMHQRALELEPLSLPVNRSFGMLLYHSRKYEEAEQQLQKTVDLDPSFMLGHYAYSTALRLRGKHAEAAESFARGLESVGNREAAQRARQSFAADGWKGFERFRSKDAPMNRPRYLVATSYAELGENDRAFEALSQAIERRESFVTLIKVDPLLDPLRADPRFQELIKKVGFP